MKEPADSKKSIVGSVAILAAAIAIAWIDTRPSWDDTGVTAALLLLTAAGGALTGVSWWMASILTCAPIVLWEIWRGTGVLIAIPVVIAGALTGAFVRRWSRRN